MITSARALCLGGLPNVDWLLDKRGSVADWFSEALKDKGIRACIPGLKQRKKTIILGKRRYKQRSRSYRDIATQCTARQAQGLAACGNQIRPLSQSIPLGHRTDRTRQLLAVKLNEART